METNHTRLAKDRSLRVFLYSAIALMFVRHFGDITSLVEGIYFIEQIAEHGTVVCIALFPTGVTYATIWSLSWLLRHQ
jgi:hypothetical protein